MSINKISSLDDGKNGHFFKTKDLNIKELTEKNQLLYYLIDKLISILNENIWKIQEGNNGSLRTLFVSMFDNYVNSLTSKETILLRRHIHNFDDLEFLLPGDDEKIIPPQKLLLPPDRKNELENILHGLISFLLLQTKYNQDVEEVFMKEVDLSSMIEKIVKKNDHKQVNIDVNIPDGVRGSIIYGDFQIFLGTLLEKIIRYGSPKNIKIFIRDGSLCISDDGNPTITCDKEFIKRFECKKRRLNTSITNSGLKRGIFKSGTLVEIKLDLTCPQELYPNNTVNDNVYCILSSEIIQTEDLIYKIFGCHDLETPIDLIKRLEKGNIEELEEIDTSGLSIKMKSELHLKNTLSKIDNLPITQEEKNHIANRLISMLRNSEKNRNQIRKSTANNSGYPSNYNVIENRKVEVYRLFKSFGLDIPENLGDQLDSCEEMRPNYYISQEFIGYEREVYQNHCPLQLFVKECEKLKAFSLNQRVCIYGHLVKLHIENQVNTFLEVLLDQHNITPSEKLLKYTQDLKGDTSEKYLSEEYIGYPLNKYRKLLDDLRSQFADYKILSTGQKSYIIAQIIKKKLNKTGGIIKRTVALVAGIIGIVTAVNLFNSDDMKPVGNSIAADSEPQKTLNTPTRTQTSEFGRGIIYADGSSMTKPDSLKKIEHKDIENLEAYDSQLNNDLSVMVNDYVLQESGVLDYPEFSAIDDFYDNMYDFSGDTLQVAGNTISDNTRYIDSPMLHEATMQFRGKIERVLPESITPDKTELSSTDNTGEQVKQNTRSVVDITPQISESKEIASRTHKPESLDSHSYTTGLSYVQALEEKIKKSDGLFQAAVYSKELFGIETRVNLGELEQYAIDYIDQNGLDSDTYPNKMSANLISKIVVTYENNQGLIKYQGNIEVEQQVADVSEKIHGVQSGEYNPPNFKTASVNTGNAGDYILHYRSLLEAIQKGDGLFQVAVYSKKMFNINSRINLRDLERFAISYIKKNNIAPDTYPLKMPAELLTQLVIEYEASNGIINEATAINNSISTTSLDTLIDLEIGEEVDYLSSKGNLMKLRINGEFENNYMVESISGKGRRLKFMVNKKKLRE